MRWRLAWLAMFIIAIAVGGNLGIVIWDVSEQQKLGRAHFPISCDASSQRLFDEGLVSLHLQRFLDSEAAFAAIVQAEPDCAIAYWGIAMSRLGRPVAGFRAPDDIRTGRQALLLAETASIASPRERDYLAAAKLIFGSDDRIDWPERAVSYEHAMQAIAARYPQDPEAVIFYALALSIAVAPEDKSLRNQTKASELLLIALGEHPDHPGLSHYLIYCLNRSSHEGSDPPSLSRYRLISQIQSALAALALLGVSFFLAAVWPIWSRAKGV